MDDARIKEFLKSMRLAFVNAGVYRGEHPVFKKAIDNFSRQLQALFSIRGSIDIGIKPAELVIAGKIFKGDRIYTDTAAFFHLRKVKMIVFRPGAGAEELMTFFLELSVSPQLLSQAGGAQAVLKKKGIVHVSAKSLDYSELLKTKQSGVLDNDVWDFLLKSVYQTDFSQDSSAGISQLRDLLDDVDLSRAEDDPAKFEKVKEIIRFLKKKWPGKSALIDQEILRAGLKNRNQLRTDNFVTNDIRDLIEGLDSEKALDVLWEKVFEKKDFSPVVFNVFSCLTGTADNKEISSLWEQKMQSSADRVRADMVKNNIEDILVLKKQDVFVSRMYGNTLSFLSRLLKEENTLSFNEQDLNKSSLYIYLNMLEKEDDFSFCRILLDNIIDEFETGCFFSDGMFISSLLNLIDARLGTEGSEPEKKYFSGKLDRALSCIEKKILEEGCILEKKDFAAFLKLISSSCLDGDIYLKTILSGKSDQSQVLSVYCSLFPEAFDRLAQALRRHLSDPRLFSCISDTLSRVDSRRFFKLLRDLYPQANVLLKTEILIRMQSLSFIAPDFIFENLSSPEFFIRKEAVKLILKLKPDDRGRAISSLLFFFNPIGIFNRRLCENISMLGDSGIKDAVPFLENIDCRWFICKAGQVRKGIDLALKKLRKDEI